LIPPGNTGIDFANKITESDTFNILTENISTTVGVLAILPTKDWRIFFLRAIWVQTDRMSTKVD